MSLTLFVLGLVINSALGASLVDPMCANSPAVPCVAGVESILGHGFELSSLSPTNVVLPISYTDGTETLVVPGFNVAVKCPRDTHCTPTNVQRYRESVAVDTKSLITGFTASAEIDVDQEAADFLGASATLEISTSSAALAVKKTRYRHLVNFRLNSSPSSFNATTSAFQADVLALPPWSNQSATAYKAFFDSYGTRLISSVTFGIQYYLRAQSSNCSFDATFVSQLEANVTTAANAFLSSNVIDSEFKSRSSLIVNSQGGDDSLCRDLATCKPLDFMASATPLNVVPVKLETASFFTIVPSPYRTWLDESESWYLDTYKTKAKRAKLGLCSSSATTTPSFVSLAILVVVAVVVAFF